jgi:hypothetical protein
MGETSTQALVLLTRVNVDLAGAKNDMATIVEYTDEKKPANSYPKRIVSPVAPGLCCYSKMEQIGTEQREEGWSFIYKRCKKCGFTVRHVTGRDPQFITKKGSRFDYQELLGGRN